MDKRISKVWVAILIILTLGFGFISGTQLWGMPKADDLEDMGTFVFRSWDMYTSDEVADSEDMPLFYMNKFDYYAEMGSSKLDCTFIVGITKEEYELVEIIRSYQVFYNGATGMYFYADADADASDVVKAYIQNAKWYMIFTGVFLLLTVVAIISRCKKQYGKTVFVNEDENFQQTNFSNFIR